MTGKVYIVGAGPGDPDLITIKGLNAIEIADVILYDRLINEQLLTYAPAHAKRLYCGKAPSHHAMPQEEINQLMVTLAQKGYTVTRLKGGDPFVFGRGGEEAQVLNDHHIPFEIVPGITSGIAAPAYAGIPVTHRDYSSSVTFVTAVTQNGVNTADYWQHLAQGFDTLCIYMGVKKITRHMCVVVKTWQIRRHPCRARSSRNNGTTTYRSWHVIDHCRTHCTY
ncbi:uroporphyrinogen-III C-methyltransferase [Staphylococcus agnetis]|uniref:uroporphyrinogen-III C-methyltransferase n=1 Tax=Staphylococcus agnetis TaxID=985762 RepID=UPI001F32C33F|nr:uroporphyrinogen-III C-methyltransferase [Staphylococcus agnetis]